MNRLTPRYQRAISLRYLAELDATEAARSMGLAKPAFAVVLSRAMKSLRREIERERERSSHDE
jgi:DNA-directed RNA polymerase specialized sigma24 family protein